MARRDGGIKDGHGGWSQKPNEREIGNVAYQGPRISGNGDAASGDGWKYRGRGLLQITGKGNYLEIQKTISKHASDAGVDIADVGDRDYTPKEAALTGMADWYSSKGGMYQIADGSNQGLADDKVVDGIVNNINSGTDSKQQRKVWYRGGEAGSGSKKLTVSAGDCMKAVFQVAICTRGKGGKKIGDGKWHDPVDNPQLRGWYNGWHPEESKFGPVRDNGGRNHQGFDIYAPVGTNAYACVSGVILKTDWDPTDKKAYGNWMLLKGNYAGKTYYFFYGHLNKFIKKKGDVVEAGDVIGETGKTGNAYSMKTYQEHLHFEVRTTGDNLGKGLGGRMSPSSVISELNKDSLLSPTEVNQPK